MPAALADKKARARKRRFRREDWLARSLDVLAREGESWLHIDHLAHRLGVTKGSFYWHFRDRADFVRQLATYWEQVFTQRAGEQIAEPNADPREKLAMLAKMIIEGDLGRYDIVMRAWAAHETEVAKAVKRVDAYRIRVVRSLFSAMGFEGEALETRTRIFMTFFGFEHGLAIKESKKKKLAALEGRLAFFTRR
ncbi:MAG: TetR family transcriptional regulator [Gammaproteobacteria bacterium]|nr:TetR/AcrR family transcriptional regulator [Gammaproteobacteria bacterium]NIR24695.1 TetR/AcrR family transcriptional regulator [Gammaproteobacteria bacterium]NIS06309.1 TetR/AcrR family transcriptional regulator [Gammaproteobacteria bacterium]NIU42135.1 TetR family transcriptional regulator [Gammaproteobacteria bacterium]NIV49065.1 TetR family transcriptional regulator [Gammaproteobacteria bacterium]